AVALAVEANGQRRELQDKAYSRNQEAQNPTPEPFWHERDLAELAIEHLRASDHATGQIYATLALAAEIRALRRHFDGEAQEEANALFGNQRHYDHIPDNELPGIPL